jgi:hypothetical protein
MPHLQVTETSKLEFRDHQLRFVFAQDFDGEAAGIAGAFSSEMPRTTDPKRGQP